MVRRFDYQFAWLFGFLLTLSACSTFSPGYSSADFDTANKAIVSSAGELRAANVLLQEAIRSQAIKKEDAQQAKNVLQDAKTALDNARVAVETGGDPFASKDLTDQVSRMVGIVLVILQPYIDKLASEPRPVDTDYTRGTAL